MGLSGGQAKLSRDLAAVIECDGRPGNSAFRQNALPLAAAVKDRADRKHFYRIEGIELWRVFDPDHLPRVVNSQHRA